MRRAVVLAASAVVMSGCDWIALGTNALRYRTVQRGEVANLAVLDSIVYATKGEDGLAIVDGRSGQLVGTVPPPTGAESVDDVAIDGDLLFALDARPPGQLAVFRLDDPLHPRPLAVSAVPVGPFSGVSAHGGLCIVSGGTSALTAWRYDSTGALHGPVATADLGRGQPDVTVAPNGRLAYVSTHYRGPRFGLDVVRYDSATGLTVVAELPIPRAGFTRGGAKPANFPIEMASLGGDTVLVAFAGGLAVVTAPAGQNFVVSHVVDVGGAAVNVDARGSLAAVVVAAPSPALVIVDISMRPPSVVRRLALPPGTFPTAAAFTRTRVAVAAGDRGVLLLDP